MIFPYFPWFSMSFLWTKCAFPHLCYSPRRSGRVCRSPCSNCSADAQCHGIGSKDQSKTPSCQAVDGVIDVTWVRTVVETNIRMESNPDTNEWWKIRINIHMSHSVTLCYMISVLVFQLYLRLPTCIIYVLYMYMCNCNGLKNWSESIRTYD